jgi:NAD(P)-dependent dehydrogenase (short-subunit alcohol dehydrogenase family)
MSEQSTPDGEPAVSNLLDLTGETVLVTGASGNIGHSIARRLAEAGAQLILHYHRDEASAEALAPELGATTVQADLCEAGAVAAMFMACDATLLVNKAMLRTNLDGPFLVLQAAAHAWGERGGAVVNVASLEGSDPAAGHAHYATSKAGLIMFSRAAALEYGPRGIRVNSVSPGLIHREGIERDWPDGVARWQARAPLGRLGTPNDVADAVLFLLSPAARWISGTNLVVDGGMSAQSRW